MNLPPPLKVALLSSTFVLGAMDVSAFAHSLSTQQLKGAGMLSPQQDTAVILEASEARNEAMVTKDVAALDALLADGFIAVHISGYQQPKNEWLEQITSGEMTYHDVEVVSATVEITGDVGILTTRNLVDATIYGARRVWPLASVTTYARQAGSWIAVQSASTMY